MRLEAERKEVFAWYGAAAYYAQCIEVELQIARLTLVREGESEPTDEEWARLESERRPLGGLARLLRENLPLDPDEVEMVTTCVDKRNWLAHRYWYERWHLLASSEGCRKAVDELRDLCELFKKGDLAAERVSARVRERVGISEQLVQQLKDEFRRRTRSGEPPEAVIRDQTENVRRAKAEARDQRKTVG